jgi:hypothetical protein
MLCACVRHFSSQSIFINLGENAILSEVTHTHKFLHFTVAGTGIAQWFRAELRSGLSWVRVLAGAENFSLHHRAQTGSGAHPASLWGPPSLLSYEYQGLLPWGGKAAGM